MDATFYVKCVVGARGFHSGVVLNVDGEDYYLLGLPIEEGADELDVPDHEWVVAQPVYNPEKYWGKGRLFRRHGKYEPDGDSQDRAGEYVRIVSCSVKNSFSIF